MTQLDQFIQLLEAGPQGIAHGVFNPWGDVCAQYDLSADAPAIRREQLRRYLETRLSRARYALVAEAPSYAGAKFCGIAMCCERMMLAEPLDADSAFFAGQKQRTSRATPGLHNDAGMLERTASIVWRTMADAGFHPHDWVTWNAFAWHPFEAGKPLTNRTPTPVELMAGLPALYAFLDLFPKVQVVAVGQVCQRVLSLLQVGSVGVRHPSYGGAPEFRAGMAAIAATV